MEGSLGLQAATFHHHAGAFGRENLPGRMRPGSKGQDSPSSRSAAPMKQVPGAAGKPRRKQRWISQLGDAG
jgi:hypothetical protein